MKFKSVVNVVFCCFSLFSINSVAANFNGFNPDDKSTWGEVVETTANGLPSVYVKKLENGGTQTLSFFHGTENKLHKPSNDIVGSKYIHWNRPDKKNPVVILDETTGVWSPIVKKYAKVWSKMSPYVNLVVERVGSDSQGPGYATKKCRTHHPGVIVICNYNFSENPEVINKIRAYPQMPGAYAWTDEGADGHIKSARIHINSNFYKFDEKRVPLGPIYHISELFQSSETRKKEHVLGNRNMVVCHELGHALGLKHFTNNPELDTCMAYATNPGGHLEPNDADISTIESTHNHTHDKKGSNGYVCTFEDDRIIEKSYFQRVRFNGAPAIATKYITTHKATQNKSTFYASHPSLRLVNISVGNQHLSYSWWVPNYSKMEDHKTGKFPSLASNRVAVIPSSKYNYSNESKAIDKITKEIAAFHDGVHRFLGRKTKCRLMSNRELAGVERFRPPAEGQNTGSYELNYEYSDLIKLTPFASPIITSY